MTQVDASVFRKYDIRGTVAGDSVQITPDLARLVGKALGTYLPREFGTDHMFVGQDNRISSPPLKMALIEGVATVKQMLDRAGTAVKKITWPNVPIDKLHDPQQREQLRQFIVDEAWGHHASCSNKMGPDTDPMSVLDSRFRVRQTEGLRVVDASVFPRIPGYFIVSAIYMISEKALDVILEDAKS